jgi:nitrogen fixation/metabolism regulation signal transduction histidine kinase
VPSAGPAEIAELTGQFNEMAESLEASRDELESQNAELEAQTIELEDQQTKLAAAHDALRESSVLLSAVSEGTSDIVTVKDLEGRYVMINPAGAEGVFGRPVEEVMGKTTAELLPSRESAERAMASDRRVME